MDLGVDPLRMFERWFPDGLLGSEASKWIGPRAKLWNVYKSKARRKAAWLGGRVTGPRDPVRACRSRSDAALGRSIPGTFSRRTLPFGDQITKSAF